MRKFGFIASGVVVGSSLMIATSALAGGFAIREQSTTGLGVAFADSAAGSDLSSMYWNPAAVTTQDGLNSLSSFSAIFPEVDIDSAVGIDTKKDDIGLLGASYYNYQVNQQLYIGVSLTSPLGLVTTANPKVWEGDEYFQKSEMLTFNATPTVGYKITPEFSVAAGLQVQYMQVRLQSQVDIDKNPVLGALGLGRKEKVTKGDDVALGFTLGALYKSDAGTSVGVGYRSAVKHTLKGKLHVKNHEHPAVRGVTDISAEFEAPQMITASVRQQVTPDLAVMANYEWTNWGTFKEFQLIDIDTGLKRGAAVAYEWKDSWFASVGAEMRLTQKITGRAGLAYEKSPVPNSTRGPALPDSDRTWLSFGGSYMWSEATTLDFGYSHIFFKDTNIDLADDAKVALEADVDNSIDILSVGMRTKW